MHAAVMVETNRVLRVKVSELNEDNRFPYVITFELGNEQRGTLKDADDLEAVLRNYRVQTLEVRFEGNAQRQMMA